MARKDDNRVRGITISFYVTAEENTELQARIKLSGMAKGEYFRQSLLHQKIYITAGKYKSDRLSLELRKLREAFEASSDIDDIRIIMAECKALLAQLHRISDDNHMLLSDDFKTK